MTTKKSKIADDKLKIAAIPNEKKPVLKAHDQANKDIEQDPDLSTKTQQGDDLDEGELARLEGED